MDISIVILAYMYFKALSYRSIDVNFLHFVTVNNLV